MKFITPAIISTIAFLSGCQSESHHYYEDDSSYHSSSYETEYVSEYVFVEELVDDPYIDAFDVTDSYGNNTEIDGRFDLRISPHVDGGHFEVYWSVHNDYDYNVNIRVSDTPNAYDSVIIGSDYCGHDLPCDYNGIQYCRYTESDTVFCNDDFDDHGDNEVYVGDYLTGLPDTLYLIIEACNTFETLCEYNYQEVTIE